MRSRSLRFSCSPMAWPLPLCGRHRLTRHRWHPAGLPTPLKFTRWRTFVKGLTMSDGGFRISDWRTRHPPWRPPAPADGPDNPTSDIRNSLETPRGKVAEESRTPCAKTPHPSAEESRTPCAKTAHPSAEESRTPCAKTAHDVIEETSETERQREEPATDSVSLFPAACHVKTTVLCPLCLAGERLIRSPTFPCATPKGPRTNDSRYPYRPVYAFQQTRPQTKT